MTISIISAMGKNHVIGKDNVLPWDMPADMKYFMDTTENTPVIMGARSFESILGLSGNPLPNRFNIVLNKNPKLKESYLEKGADYVTNDADEALKKGIEIAEKTGKDEVFIIGGAMTYKTFLPRVQKMYLTFIDGKFEGDTFFPEFDESDWKEISREDHDPDERNKYPYSFIIFERKS